MKETIHLIPGYGETCSLQRYQTLISLLKKQSHKVKPVNPDWYTPLSQQAFRIKKDDIVIGFSYGAIIAYLVAKKYPCRKVIFASMSPIHKFPFKLLVKEDMKHMSREKAEANAKDIKSIRVDLKKLKTPYIALAGELEKDITADLLVPKTGHRMTAAYVRAIAKLV